MIMEFGRVPIADRWLDGIVVAVFMSVCITRDNMCANIALFQLGHHHRRMLLFMAMMNVRMYIASVILTPHNYSRPIDYCIYMNILYNGLLFFTHRSKIVSVHRAAVASRLQMNGHRNLKLN